MDVFLQYVKKFDWMLFGAATLLLVMGLLTIYSIDGSGMFFRKQLIWGGISLAAFFVVGLLNYRVLRNHSLVVVFLYIVMIILLSVLLLLNYKVRGIAGWFHIAGIYIQPAEFVRIVLVVLLAKYFSVRHIEMYKFRHIIISSVYVGIPFLLIFLQPDLGTAMILFFLWFGVVMIAGIKKYHFGFLALGGTLISVLSWLFFLKDYQKARILFYINPGTDPLGHGYNLIQSLIAVGSAGFWGKGLGHGSQGKLGFLPEAHTDFIFAAFSEEWGSVGVILLLLIFIFILYRIVKIFFGAQNNFARLCVAGTAIVMFSQIIINIGMNVGLFPITGITLPFISYGGSSLLTNFIFLGLMESIKARS